MRHAHLRSLTLCVLLFLVGATPFGIAPRASHRPYHYQSTGATGEAQWRTYAVEGEEFVVSFPNKPRMLSYGVNIYYEPHGEKILEHRLYSAYANEAVFIIKSYKVKNPKKALKEIFNAHRHIHGRDASLDDFTGKQHRSLRHSAYESVQYDVMRQHVYIFQVISTSEQNPFIERFFSTLRLGEALPDAEVNLKLSSLETDDVSENSSESPLSSREVTRKARLLWRPEPSYTDAARKHNRQGYVRVRAVLSPTGNVSRVELIKGLPDGLSEQAIKAARSIRYLPAEKDGQLVSQYIIVEYSFNIY